MSSIDWLIHIKHARRQLYMRVYLYGMKLAWVLNGPWWIIRDQSNLFNFFKFKAMKVDV